MSQIKDMYTEGQTQQQRPSGVQLYADHEGRQVHFDEFNTSLETLTSAFNEWFAGFKALNQDLKSRDKAKKAYDHYNTKL